MPAGLGSGFSNISGVAVVHGTVWLVGSALDRATGNRLSCTTAASWPTSWAGTSVAWSRRTTCAYSRRRVKLPDGRHELRTDREKFRDLIDMLHSGKAQG